MAKTVRYFTAPWCVPCKQLLPKVKKLCRDNDIMFEEVNIDQQPSIAAHAGVQGVPSVSIDNGPVFKATDVPFVQLKKLILDA